MQFETQKQVLEYLGKNPNDRALIQRMRQRGELYKEDGMYHLITNKQRLIDENRELKLRVKELEKSESNFMQEQAHLKEYFKIKDELAEAKIQWEYYQRLYEEEKSDKAYRLRKAFNWISQKVRGVNWDEFNEWVMDDELPF